ncbi:hypothetical protein PRIPAC_97982 [Pristionchus pacificus]|uniref:Uncharacterized protein n=1 Tax=Pristionchus pacificus TaxID=54126 RepID=A0A454XKT2_PRIPA|nr:hypothetical protein PRIPAC_97982 [Pristionchus pacificus]|eukprot:PDM81730.1 hypothetical protein PRIPAC_30711 [Pristionchus pacificus]
MLAPLPAPPPPPLPPQDVPLPSTWPVVPVEKRRVDNGTFSIDQLMSPKTTESRRNGAKVEGSRPLEKLLGVSDRQKRVENLEKIVDRLRWTRLEQEATMKSMKEEAARENRNARERERRAKARATRKQKGLIGPKGQH